MDRRRRSRPASTSSRCSRAISRGPPPRQARRLEGEFDVLLRGQPGQQRIGLEDDAAIEARAGDRLAVGQENAAGRSPEGPRRSTAACTCRSRRCRQATTNSLSARVKVDAVQGWIGPALVENHLSSTAMLSFGSATSPSLGITEQHTLQRLHALVGGEAENAQKQDVADDRLGLEDSAATR